MTTIRVLCRPAPPRHTRPPALSVYNTFAAGHGCDRHVATVQTKLMRMLPQPTSCNHLYFGPPPHCCSCSTATATPPRSSAPPPPLPHMPLGRPRTRPRRRGCCTRWPRRQRLPRLSTRCSTRSHSRSGRGRSPNPLSLLDAAHLPCRPPALPAAGFCVPTRVCPPASPAAWWWCVHVAHCGLRNPKQPNCVIPWPAARVRALDDCAGRPAAHPARAGGGRKPQALALTPALTLNPVLT